jgi:hypothetical protein
MTDSDDTTDENETGHVLTMREEALSLASQGFRVIPINYIENGRCTCKRGEACGSDAGKHPWIAEWQKEATTDRGMINKWWGKKPLSNIGIACGGDMRLVVLDVDGEKGRASLAALEAQQDALPHTLRARSGRVEGGEHIYLRVPDGLAMPKNSAGKIAPGLDLRAEGGQVVAPPSIHRSGRQYEWIAGSEPAEMPGWLYALATGGKATECTAEDELFGPAEGFEVLTDSPHHDPLGDDPQNEPKHAESFTSQVHGPHALAYVRKALEDACANLRTCPRGGRNTLAAKEAFSVGGLVATGLLSEREAVDALLASTAGWDQDKADTTASTVRNQVREGQRKPRSIPPPLPATVGGRVSPTVPLDIEPLLARFVDIAKADATTTALAPDFLDACSTISERSPDFARLCEALKARGVKVQSWTRALRGHKQATRPAPRQPQRLPSLRPMVTITEEEHDVNDAAVSALSALPHVFQRASALVTVIESHELVPGEPEPIVRQAIAPLAPATLRELLTRAATWEEQSVDRRTGEAYAEPAHPPEWAVAAVHARRKWSGIRTLTNVAECPILRPDGTVLSVPGWDQATGILFVPSLDFPAIADDPTADDVTAARELLLDVVKDYPFESGPRGVHAATWIASLLTPIARYAFSGPAPMFIIDANVRSSGKSMLADVTSIIVSGRNMTRTTPTEDEEEDRKNITSIAVDGEMLVLFDNIDKPFGSTALNIALTTTEWAGRILGTQQKPKCPLYCTWYGTGNNVQFRGDMARRCAFIRIDSKVDRPELREGLRDLRHYALTHRHELVAAALTILRAWLASDRSLPDLDGRPLRAWGSYESWSAVVRGAVVAAGLPDPGESQAGDDDTQDQDAAGLTGLLAGWEEVQAALGGTVGGVACSTVMTALQENDDARRASPGNPPPLKFPALREALVDAVPVHGNKLPSARGLSYVLRRMKKRVVKGKRFKSWKSNGHPVWAVESVGAPETTAAEAEAPIDIAFDPDFAAE